MERAEETLRGQGKYLRLYTSQLCYQSIKLLAYFNHFAVAHSISEVEFACPAALPVSSRYKATPILDHGGKLIEDSRAILLYADENFFCRKLNSLPAASINLFFEKLEVLDEEILPAIVAPLVLDPGSYQESLEFSRRSFLYERIKLATRTLRLKRYLDAPLFRAPYAKFSETLSRCSALVADDFLLEAQTPYLALSLKACLKAVMKLPAARQEIDQHAMLVNWLGDKLR